jgi:hypothetical protein
VDEIDVQPAPPSWRKAFQVKDCRGLRQNNQEKQTLGYGGQQRAIAGEGCRDYAWSSV